MRPSFLVITGLVLLSHRAAFAEGAGSADRRAVVERPAVEQPAAEAAPPAASLNTVPAHDATAGVVVILASLAAGAALSAYGLTIDCGPSDHACHRRAAAPIWGGVGVAAVGSLVGLRLLEPSLSRSAALITLHGTF
jgi:hypothetical protein